MEVLAGTVSNLRFSSSVSGTQHTTTTTQIAVFDLENRPVEISSSDSILINDGDYVAVAGDLKKGILRAIAYKNTSKNVAGGKGSAIQRILGTIFTVGGLATLIGGIGFIFVGIGIYCFRMARIRSAAHAAVANFS